jgi:16S rRNA (adenine1518-N6/adenine1519-N6)-dimethyltransferase
LKISSRKKKSLGQHFLHDPRIIEQIVDYVAPQPADHIVEIGPGAGALTSKLLPLVNSMDVVEIDHSVIPELKKNCENSEHLRICIGDVLRVDFAKFPSPLRLVGNLPYNISTPFLFKAVKNIDAVKDMYFMLQKEVAERIVASSGSKVYGRLSIMLQYYCEVELLLHVGSGAFSPPPKVDSAFIRLIPRKHYSIVAQDRELFGEIVRAAFCQRRKVISNGLKKYISASQLKEVGIDPVLRPEQLLVDDFVRISNFVCDSGVG